MGTTTLSYDANGNLTDDGTNTLTWNARNQLTAMSGGTTASFQYDAFSRRTNKTIGGVPTGFLHDGINPVQEQFTGGVNANLLAGSVDEFFSRTDQLGTQTLLTDALGSTWGLADPSATILTQYTYEPFGNSTVSGSTFSPFQYTGRENDGTGFLYYRARYYQPSGQRFTAEDPLHFTAGDTNLYAYVRNSTLNYADPSGELPLIVPILPIGAAYGAGVQACGTWAQGGSTSDIAKQAAIGALAGTIAAGVGAGTGVLTANPFAIGAAANASFGLTVNGLNNESWSKIGLDLLVDVAVGGALGRVTHALLPTVRGPDPKVEVAHLHRWDDHLERFFA
ncbi:MAG: RHS repeat-associated core domain-containing protein [Candidatus Acidiferrales bacterium]